MLSFSFEGTDDLVRQLRRMEKKFPASTERVLQKETRNIAKDLKRETSRQTKKHGIQQGRDKKYLKAPVYLAESYQPGRVRKIRGDYRSAVISKASHYHLVEGGHEPGGWHARQGNASPVRGKKIVAAYMAKRSRYAQLIGQEILEEVLSEAT